MGEGTDQNYTNGWRLQWDRSLDEIDPSAPAAELAAALDLWELGGDVEHEAPITIVSWGVGQLMFTPENIRATRLITDDRPYAGWLFGTLVRTDRWLDVDEARRDDVQASVELQLGSVGPYSFAEPAQKLVHEIVNSPEPRGWRHQLDNEPGVLLRMMRRNRIGFRREGEWCGDVITSWGGSLGNVRTWTEATVVARLGPGLPRDFGYDLAESGQPVQYSNTAGWTAYAFTGMGGRYVLRDIFLDGNSFSGSSHTVPKEHLVGDFRAGFVLQGPLFALSWTQVYRSREFTRQDEPHTFGSLVASVSRRF